MMYDIPDRGANQNFNNKSVGREEILARSRWKGHGAEKKRKARALEMSRSGVALSKALYIVSL